MPATPPPIKNQPVTRLLIPILRSAKFIDEAKRGPIERPMTTVLIQSAYTDPAADRTATAATTHPVMLIIRIDLGLSRIEIGTDSSLPIPWLYVL